MPMITTDDANGSEVPARLPSKVFIDGLPFQAEALEQQLAEYVRTWKVGTLVRLIKKEGQGFGFAVFRSPHSVDVAVRVLNGKKFLGRRLRVEVPRAPSESKGEGPAASTQWDSSRQVLLSDLPRNADADAIREELRAVAPQLESGVETIKLVGQGRKAFLTVTDATQVDALIAVLNGFSLYGRTIAAERAQPPGTLPFSPTPRSTPKGGTKTPTPAPPPAPPLPAADVAPLGSRPVPAVRSVILGNVPEGATRDDVARVSGRCGIVKSVEMIYNPHTCQSTGMARVTFATPKGAAQAMGFLQGSLIHGSPLVVEADGNLDGPPSTAVRAAGGERRAKKRVREEAS